MEHRQLASQELKDKSKNLKIEICFEPLICFKGMIT